MTKIQSDAKTLAPILQALRAQGKRVVLANGCFDLLHVGHVRFLVDAKSRGDFLVVALNTDASVRANKGADRPLMPQDERAEILAAFRCVDYVTFFSEPTADEILRTLQPDIQAKGTDYRPEAVPEAATAEELGIATVICGDPKDHSTRDLLEKLQSSIVAPAPRTESALKKSTADVDAPGVAPQQKVSGSRGS